MIDGLSGKDTWGLDLGSGSLGGLDWALSINGVTEGVNDTAKQGLTNGNVDLARISILFLAGRFPNTHDLTSSLDGFAFLDSSVGTEKHNTDLSCFQVHAHTLHT